MYTYVYACNNNQGERCHQFESQGEDMRDVEGGRQHGRGWREEREGGSDVITI